MLESFKSYVKTRPRLYDSLDRLRPLGRGARRWLDDFSRSKGRRVNFVQIGASDGLRWDPVRRFIIRDTWNGVLVEPLPPVFEQLRSNYAHVTNRKLVFANVAVSCEDRGTIQFWSISREFGDSLPLELRFFYLRKSSTDREMLLKALEHLGSIEDKVECHDVQCLSTTSLIDSYWDGGDIDLIFIDAEGHDDYVIKGIDFERIQPKAIFYESHNLQDRKELTQEYLESKGYTVRNLGGDTVAVK